ncbi:hypothetical protein B0H14DRAFT_3164135 [Mycena olivaceomarginata]|nr:hypothetical protein B0H14DRAFT_3164135 [Mycena olivaceomarginata]
MSCFNILGFFKLKSGRRASVQKPNNTQPTSYAHYNTRVWTLANTAVSADLRLFASSSTPLLPDDTVAFAVCTAQSVLAGTSNSLILDVLTFIVLPGDPSTDTYNDQLPDDSTSMVFGVGRVTGSPQILDDGHSSRLITLSLTDFVRGETKGSTIQCVFDLSTSRWTRAPTPRPTPAFNSMAFAAISAPPDFCASKLNLSH